MGDRRQIKITHDSRGSIFEYGRDGKLERHADIVTDGCVNETEHYD